MKKLTNKERIKRLERRATLQFFTIMMILGALASIIVANHFESKWEEGMMGADKQIADALNILGDNQESLYNKLNHLEQTIIGIAMVVGNKGTMEINDTGAWIEINATCEIYEEEGYDLVIPTADEASLL